MVSAVCPCNNYVATRNFSQEVTIRPRNIMAGAFMTWLEGSCEILFPRECLVCCRPLKGRSLCFRCHPPAPTTSSERCHKCFAPLGSHGDGDMCATCLTYPPPTEHMRYLWEYGGVARDFIRAMKYQPSVYLTRYAATLLRAATPVLFPKMSWDLIVPIPSSPKMLKKRLFHPCFEIARLLVKDIPGAKVSYALRHARKRSPQARLSHAERLQGLRRFFQVCSPLHIHGKSVLLVEDVITTGATIAAASHALYQAGATRVDVVALAQARVWTRFRDKVYKLAMARRAV